jgi:hypothetical protein
MKRFLIRCAVAGAMIGGAAAASFSTVSSGMSTGIAIGSSSAAPATAAPAAAAPAAPAANTNTTSGVAVAAPAAGSPPDPSNAKGCVGNAVSTAAHELGGLGDAFKDANAGPPGKAIQGAVAYCKQQ